MGLILSKSWTFPTLVLSQHEIKFKHNSKNYNLWIFEAEIQLPVVFVETGDKYSICYLSGKGFHDSESPGYVTKLSLPSATRSLHPAGRCSFTKVPPLVLEKQESEKAWTLSALLHVAQGPGGRSHLPSPHTGRCPSHDRETLVTEVDRTWEKK